MEYEVRLERKGRILIPARVRRLLGLREGSILILRVRGDSLILAPKRRVTVDDLYGLAGGEEVEIEEVESSLSGEEVR
ncbi:MAG: AbrB/MazE/SpoVT family DNA-binding domain-containing protein [Candidatus Korarchaeota archaeon]|nr:AbrB/MazE/SpoVT family DNA-binding domain-containing protein [Candidatus Korarchaeota archaeon]